jgi:light-regulated signal transduction histidine kinase (bacteriophytochrome)
LDSNEASDMPSKNSGEDLSDLRELQRFSDAAVHNLRAPLRSIGTSAELLANEWKDRFDERASAYLTSILTGVARIDDLARSLADYSMTLVHDSSAILILPVQNALQTALSSMKKQIATSHASVHSENLPQLGANHEQLSVLFRCLLSNAIEYRGPDPPHIELDATRSGDDWRFTFRDNGIGIAARYQQQVFEPFQRLHANARGSGLGLAICKRIVEGHGGRISLESEEGHGTTVIFTLPAEQ